MNWPRLTLSLVFLFGTASASAQPFSLTLTVGDHPRENSLVEFDLPDEAGEGQAWELVDGPGKVLPTQSLLGRPRRLLSLVPGPLKGGETRQYTLRPQLQPPTGKGEIPRGPGLRPDTGRLSLLHGQNEILTYHSATRPPPEGIAAQYARSGHIHPLKTPSGKVVTSEFPADHPHQHAVFFAWVKTQFEGHEVDFWNQGKQLGTVRHTRMGASCAGEVYAGFTSELEHVDLSAGADTIVLRETWNVMALAVDDIYLVDLESTQLAAKAPLAVEQYHYGGFGWRGPVEWLLPQKAGEPGGCQFLTSAGHDRLKGNHTRPEWVSVTGSVDGHPCTVAIFGHPENLRHPQPVRLHPDKPYFCFAPCVLGEFEITKDRPLTSRYRIVIHDGPARPERYSQLVQDWSSPLKGHTGEAKR